MCDAYQMYVEACDLLDHGEEKKGFDLLLKAAKSKESSAYTQIGFCYAHGLGVRKSEALAMRWYKKAANAGELTSVYNLGLCYFGLNNRKKAISWFKKAAAGNYSGARKALFIIKFRKNISLKDLIKWLVKNY